jgi:hypothetical protein
MTQLPPPADPCPTAPSVVPLSLPLGPAPLWTTLDSSAQKQLAQCLSALIRRIRMTQNGPAKESRHDPD